MDLIVASRKSDEPGSILPKVRFTSTTNAMVSNELPPKAKKSSSTPIGEIFKHCCHISMSLPSTRSNGIAADPPFVDATFLLTGSGQPSARPFIDEAAIDAGTASDVTDCRMLADTSPADCDICKSERCR